MDRPLDNEILKARATSLIFIFQALCMTEHNNNAWHLTIGDPGLFHYSTKCINPRYPVLLLLNRRMLLIQWLNNRFNCSIYIVVVVQSLSRVQLFVTPWTAACQTPLSSQSLLKLYPLYIQLWHTPFPILNQSTVPCPVLTVAFWAAYRFCRKQVRWSGIPISLRISHSLLWSTQSKALA